MNFRIAFKGLPFTPDREQVIYVENLFDEKVNSFIRENYDSLVNNFKMHNLEFVYLPLYFNEEIEKKAQYSVPYVTEHRTLQSNYMLDFMVRRENRTRLSPSLLFAPFQDADEWIFRGVTMFDMIEDNVEICDIVGMICGKNSFEPAYIRIVKEDKPINEAVNEPYASYSCETEIPSLQDTAEDDNGGIRFRISRNKEDNDDVLFRGIDDDKIVEPEIDDETLEELLGIYSNLQSIVKSLRLRGIALGAIHKFIDEQEPLSPLVITEDMRLFLPLYNNIEIELSAQKKALYFLFLNHPEGIVLQHLGDYHNELVNYYKQTNNGVLTPKMEDSIRKLETYGNNQLYVVIARIREAFCVKFDERLARNYFIRGEKGQPYHISLDQELIKWED